jgi:hypothetical protein
MSNSFNPISGSGLNGGLLSLFDASYTSGLLVPHYLRTLKNKYGDNGLSDFQLLMGLGMKRGVQNITGWHWEKGFYDSAINGTVTTDGASQIVVTVTAETIGSTNIDKIYAKEGQIVMVASESTLPLARVSSVVAGLSNTFAVTLDAVETGSLSVLAEDDAATLIVVGSAWAEGTDQPTSSQSFWTKYNWQTQIFKETYELTGTQKTNAPQFMEVEYGDGRTKKMNGFFYEGQDEAEYRLIKQIALSMIFGKKNTNTAVPQTFSGLDAEIADRGYTAEIGATAGSFDVADLRAIATEMSKRYSSNLFLTWLTQELYSELNQDANSTGYFGNANVNALNSSIADVFFGGNMSEVEALTGTLSFQGLIVDGYNFMLKQARFMQDPTTMAVSGANDTLRRRGWVIPLNKMADAEGVLRNRIELVYKEMNGYSRFMEITDDGRASARKIGPTDVARLYLSSDLGFDFFVLEQFTKLQPTGL